MNEENKVEIPCKYCGSTDNIKCGEYGSHKWGLQVRRKCKKCFGTFYENWQIMEDKK